MGSLPTLEFLARIEKGNSTAVELWNYQTELFAEPAWQSAYSKDWNSISKIGVRKLKLMQNLPANQEVG